MRWIAIASLLLALPGCKTLDVKQATFSVNLNLNLPEPHK